MMNALYWFLVVIQILTYLLIFYRLFLSFSFIYRTNPKARPAQLTLEVVLSICIIFCFILNSGFRAIKITDGYYDLLTISLLGLLAFWIKKSKNIQSPYAFSILNLFIGGLFWMALLAALKLIIAYQFAAFPVLGIFIVIPIFILLMTISHLVYEPDSKKPHFEIMGALAIILLYACIQNLWTQNSWELISFITHLESDDFFCEITNRTFK